VHSSPLITTIHPYLDTILRRGIHNSSLPNLRQQHKHSSSAIVHSSKCVVRLHVNAWSCEVSEKFKPSGCDVWTMYIRQFRNFTKYTSLTNNHLLETTACYGAAELMIRRDDVLLSTVQTSIYKFTVHCLFHSSCKHAFSVSSRTWRQIRAEPWKNCEGSSRTQSWPALHVLSHRLG
jgi:hypothetical protein